jgi:hypothetical protein
MIKTEFTQTLLKLGNGFAQILIKNRPFQDKSIKNEQPTV